MIIEVSSRDSKASREEGHGFRGDDRQKLRTSDSAESAALHCSRPVYSGLGCAVRASR
jgi:hypothetical protein